MVSSGLCIANLAPQWAKSLTMNPNINTSAQQLAENSQQYNG